MWERVLKCITTEQYSKPNNSEWLLKTGDYYYYYYYYYKCCDYDTNLKNQI